MYRSKRAWLSGVLGVLTFVAIAVVGTKALATANGGYTGDGSTENPYCCCNCGSGMGEGGSLCQGYYAEWVLGPSGPTCQYNDTNDEDACTITNLRAGCP
ncbi:MAG TPA: hypothetical protein VKT77_23095 [Chthonomonadaceae bacterium]|nr:hypothetical protein [Chthonomonadaceae bacterium]